MILLFQSKDDTMQNSIVPSQNFFGKFDAIIDGERVPCHNLATARATIANAENPSLRPFASSKPFPTVACKGFQSPSGQFYAVVSVCDTDIRVDCHNAATLRGWIKNGVGFASFAEAARDLQNHRSAGGWGA